MTRPPTVSCTALCTSYLQSHTISNTLLWTTAQHLNLLHAHASQPLLRQCFRQGLGQTIAHVVLRFAAHERYLPTCHMIPCKVVNNVNVLNDSPSRTLPPLHMPDTPSVVDAAVVACFLLLNETAPPYIVTTHSVVLLCVSWHAAKFASHQNPSDCRLPLWVMPLAAMLPTHLTMSSTAV
jgi:hypothetical protein